MLFYWTQAEPTFVAAFLASAVEFIEALTVVLAMWRGVIEFSGLAVILMASVLHRARRT